MKKVLNEVLNTANLFEGVISILREDSKPINADVMFSIGSSLEETQCIRLQFGAISEKVL